METNDFRTLRESMPDDRDLAGDCRPSIWKRLLGFFFRPTPREIQLSNQRMEAIDRAERAESVSFDAMAEMSKIHSERDNLFAKVAELEKAVQKLQKELERCK